MRRLLYLFWQEVMRKSGSKAHSGYTISMLTVISLKGGRNRGSKNTKDSSQANKQQPELQPKDSSTPPCLSWGVSGGHDVSVWQDMLLGLS